MNISTIKHLKRMINKDFFKNNFNGFHIGSMLIFGIIAAIYWWKAGQFSEVFYKNKLVLVILWGLLVGWILGDFISHARHKD